MLQRITSIALITLAAGLVSRPGTTLAPAQAKAPVATAVVNYGSSQTTDQQAGTSMVTKLVGRMQWQNGTQWKWQNTRATTAGLFPADGC